MVMRLAGTQGPKRWSLVRDKDGYKDYKIVHIVEGSFEDGPANALACPGLPRPGSDWRFMDDLDFWARCQQTASVTASVDDEPNRQFAVEQTFSTRPTPRCVDQEVQDPLMERPKVSGGFVKYTEEATRDRFNRPITNSAHEQIRGAQIEFDQNRPTVRIEKNVRTLDLALLCQMMDTVNDSFHWGLPARCIKLSNVSWEEKFSVNCLVYFTWVLEFDVMYQGFDRTLLDEGTKVLSGHWDNTILGGGWINDPVGSGALAADNPNRLNPAHFIKFKDRRGENSNVILNGAGNPYDTAINPITSLVPAALIAGDPIGIPRLTPGITYGNFDVRSNLTRGIISKSHFFKVAANGVARQTVVTTSPSIVDKINLRTYTDTGIQVIGAISIDGSQLFRIATIGTADMIIEVNYNLEPNTYAIVVDPANALPGTVRVEKYYQSNFAMLGLPAVIGP